MLDSLEDRQVGDTSPFAFRATNATTGGPLDVSNEDVFWMDLIRSNGIVKINRVVMNKDRSNAVLTYQPAPGEVDKGGAYTVQLYCLRPDGEHLVTPKMQIRIVDNARTLDFTPP